MARREDPREARLPRWVQDELRGLRSQLSEAVEALEAQAQPGGTDTYVRRRGLPDLELERGERVNFQVGHSTLQVYVADDGTLGPRLNVADVEHSGLAVFPWVTNVIHVRPVQR